MKSDRIFKIILLAGLLFHGALLFFTFERTYDAYVHIFFGSHYAESWFESWNYKWYTGFTVTSYPPLIHQLIALLSHIFGLKLSFIIVGNISILIFLTGVYRFSQLWVKKEVALYATALAIFSSSYVEALHIFGQLPSVTGIALLLNALPYVYDWVRRGDKRALIFSLLLIGVISATHHVTTIFGMVFFVFPVIGTALYDRAQATKGEGIKIGFLDFFGELKSRLPAIILFGFLSVLLLVVVLLPYWMWSRSDPIAQVSIPHGSRDSFLDVTSSGLVFFLIPWGMMLLFLPYLFKRLFERRNIFLGLSVALCFLLGTGGTTPIPRMLLGDTAFEILTLDRFTFWATIMAIPFWGAFIHSLVKGKFADYLNVHQSPLIRRCVVLLFLAGILLSTVLIVNITFFKSIQPSKIDIKPMVNFLNRDGHNDWRYLTLGFGDQVAWLSANTTALTVDGNYHSVRRLPEFTTRAVERLENAKYLGFQGLGALQQFLTVPEKYNLKFIFSNDKFYEPILYFTGWKYVQQLENGIDIWERPDIKPLPTILPRKEIPRYQSVMWGTLPIGVTSIAAFMFLFFRSKEHDDSEDIGDKKNDTFMWVHFYWALFVSVGVLTLYFMNHQDTKVTASAQNTLKAYYDAIDFKKFEYAYNFFDPKSAPSIDQFMLELSLEDGMLASYAKLDALHMDVLEESKDKIKIKATTDWITSLDAYSTVQIHELYLSDDGWLMEYEPYELDIPPDQFMRQPTVEFYNQGRRKADIYNTAREDQLDRPHIYVQSSRLVKKDKNYHIVGELINMDNDPAHLTLEGVLYDEEGKEIIRYMAKDQLIYTLLPKEKTPFKIDFEEIAWQEVQAEQPTSFDPNFSNPFTFVEKPSSFVLFVRSLVTDADLYKSFGVEYQYDEADARLSGRVVNTGSKELTITQLLITQYDEDDQLSWLESRYMPKGIRPQRDKTFDYDWDMRQPIEVIAKGNESNVFCNGKSNKSQYGSNRLPFTTGFIQSGLNKKLPKIVVYPNAFVSSIQAD